MQSQADKAPAAERWRDAVVCERMNSDSTDALLSKIKLQGIHLDLTEAMQNIIREKVATLLRRNEYIVRINVRLHQDQRLGTEHHYTATGQIEIAGPDLVASAEGKEAYDVIDQLVEKLDRQLERRHDRRKDQRNHPHAPEIETALPKIE
jgi:putative sigma-54 modulation protein